MKKDFDNKSLKSEKTKTNQFIEKATMTVYLKNHTVIDGVVYPPGYTVLTVEQYEKVQQFL